MNEKLSWRYPLKVIGECPVEFPYINHLPGNNRISSTISLAPVQDKMQEENGTKDFLHTARIGEL